MEKFNHHTGIVVPLIRDNVDTDQIMPKQFLKRVERSGFGRFVFYDWRFDADGNEKQGFALNNPHYGGGSILVTGENFGCGSSREHAPWGLRDYGFRVIIAAGYADIFYNNCFKSGILPITVSHSEIAYLAKKCESETGYTATINLPEQTITDNSGFEYPFEIDEFRKYCLERGLDDIGLTTRFEKEISEYEASRLRFGTP